MSCGWLGETLDPLSATAVILTRLLTFTRLRPRSPALQVELCFFSQIKIHPGHGKRYSRADGQYRPLVKQMFDSVPTNHSTSRGPNQPLVCRTKSNDVAQAARCFVYPDTGRYLMLGPSPPAGT